MPKLLSWRQKPFKKYIRLKISMKNVIIVIFQRNSSEKHISLNSDSQKRFKQWITIDMMLLDRMQYSLKNVPYLMWIIKQSICLRLPLLLNHFYLFHFLKWNNWKAEYSRKGDIQILCISFHSEILESFRMCWTVWSTFRVYCYKIPHIVFLNQQS